MGTFYCSVELSNLNRDSVETVEALVGSGGIQSHFPRSLLFRLGISQKERVEFERDDETVVEMGIGEAWVQIDGRKGPTTVVFNDDGKPPRLGRVTLSGLCLKVDPAENRLVKYLPRIKPPGWYEEQRLLREWVERLESERQNAANQREE